MLHYMGLDLCCRLFQVKSVYAWPPSQLPGERSPCGQSSVSEGWRQTDGGAVSASVALTVSHFRRSADSSGVVCWDSSDQLKSSLTWGACLVPFYCWKTSFSNGPKLCLFITAFIIQHYWRWEHWCRLTWFHNVQMCLKWRAEGDHTSLWNIN